MIQVTDQDISQQLTEMDDKLEEVRRALLGQEQLGHVGLVARVSKIEDVERLDQVERREAHQRIHQRIDDTNARFDRVKWIAAGAALGGAGAGGGIVALIARASGLA